MRIFKRMRVNSAIYWQKTGIDENGESIFATPIVIACRWDSQQDTVERSDNIETNNVSLTIFPDRILTLGSFLMLGDDSKLSSLTVDEKSNPALLRDVFAVKSQKVTPEWRFKNLELVSGLQSDHLMIEVTI
jgi:hypothetical protein